VSKGNSALKVLRTALKRVQKGWTQNTWSYVDHSAGKTFVCLEGALFGYCDQSKHQLTPSQIEARDTVLSVIRDRYNGKFWSIPEFNDEVGRTEDEVQEVVKLSIIRLETAEDGLNDEEVEDLLDFKDAAKGPANG
jgi:hypothetical protein